MQVIPHVTDEIKRFIYDLDGCDGCVAKAVEALEDLGFDAERA